MQYIQEVLNAFAIAKVVKYSEVNNLIEKCQEEGVSPEFYLASKRITEEKTCVKVLAGLFGMESADFDSLVLDKQMNLGIPIGLLRKNSVVPINDDDGVLTVAVATPLYFAKVSALNAFCPHPKRVILCEPAKIHKHIDSLFASVAVEMSKTDIVGQIVEQKEADDQTLESVNSAPTVRLVDSIIKEAIPLRASDIHIEPYETTVRVRYRIDGVMQERTTFPISTYSAITLRLKILCGMNIAEKRIPQDGRILMNVGGKDYDFRASSLPTVNGEKFVLRILDKDAFAFTRVNLGFTDNENKMIDGFLAQPHGIILLTGPTGCGKSTTLYSFLGEVNKPDRNIITVEDPVEFTMHGINQVQVNTKANLTFAAALRSILRQDPNIIMIGEIRDEETAQIAIRAAITGHLVFSTLHTNDAPGSISRLLDMGIEPYLLSDALVGVIAQRLVRRLCPICKKKVKTGPNLTAALGLSQSIDIYEPNGCNACNNSGYKGRIGVHEVLHINDKIKNIITSQQGMENIRDICIEDGLVTLVDSCRDLVIQGVTSVAEMLALAEKQ
ncbi:MAG: GspE/PulE family protein [Clostridia bacterium]|nr:GspE/PulE family protein [Clostridia bacterium]